MHRYANYSQPVVLGLVKPPLPSQTPSIPSPSAAHRRARGGGDGSLGAALRTQPAGQSLRGEVNSHVQADLFGEDAPPGRGERGCLGETDLRLDGETQGGGRSRRPRHSLWCDGRSGGARRAAPARRCWRLQPARCRLRKVRAAARVGEGHRGSRTELRPGKGAGSAPHKDEARPAALSCFPCPGGSGTVFPAGGCGAERYHRGRGGKEL